MTREFIINELVARGIKAEATDVTKNGVVLEGIMVGDGSVRPTLYAEWYKNIDESEIDSVIERVREVLKEVPQFNTDVFSNWDWVKTRLRLCLQKRTSESIVKRNFLDLEQYVRVMIDEEQGASFKVNPGILEKYGVSEDVLFHAAIDCTRPLVMVEDMAKMMSEMMGISIDEVVEMQGGDPPMIVITNQSKINGASSICFMDVLKEIADRYEKDLAILPSSIHECILYPVEDTTNFISLDLMVQEVNETQLKPEEVLSNHAYRFIREENRITY